MAISDRKVAGKGHLCQWFDQQRDPRDDERHECGAPAQHKVKVLGKFTKAFVYLCENHKTQVNQEFAALRHSSEYRPDRLDRPDRPAKR